MFHMLLSRSAPSKIMLFDRNPSVVEYIVTYRFKKSEGTLKTKYLLYSSTGVIIIMKGSPALSNDLPSANCITSIGLLAVMEQ